MGTGVTWVKLLPLVSKTYLLLFFLVMDGANISGPVAYPSHITALKFKARRVGLGLGKATVPGSPQPGCGVAQALHLEGPPSPPRNAALPLRSDQLT